MATIPKAIQGGEAMIPQTRLINYASNFLESEIENIEKLLKDETVDDASKDILNKLLKEYKHDLEVIEREAV
jgi:hypothetical protein